MAARQQCKGFALQGKHCQKRLMTDNFCPQRKYQRNIPDLFNLHLSEAEITTIPKRCPICRINLLD